MEVQIGLVEGILGIVALVFGPGGGVFVAVKLGFNGMKADVKEIKQTLRDHGSKLEDVREEVAFLKGQQKGVPR